MKIFDWLRSSSERKKTQENKKSSDNQSYDLTALLEGNATDEGDTENSFVFVGQRGGSLRISGDMLDMILAINKSVDDIYKDGSQNYINGIKSSLVDSVNDWISCDGESVFTLFGTMGTGKSFFAAKLCELIRERYDNVIFYSAQRTHTNTTLLQNMLYSVAYQLSKSDDPAVREYLCDHDLPGGIDALTEDIFINALDKYTASAPYIFIIDGLDEYSRSDCSSFLQALTTHHSRISSKLKIFFTGRPENYIKTYLNRKYYDIAENQDASRDDCHRYVTSLSSRYGITLSEACVERLIDKSAFSLNYIELFIREHSGIGAITDISVIDSAPEDIYKYYTSQLQQYFTKAGKLNYYNDFTRRTLAALIAAKRPLSLNDLSAITSFGITDLAEIARNSTPLLTIKSDGRIALYQDAMKDFFISTPPCPTDYRITVHEGDRLMTRAMGNLLDRGRLSHCPYLLKYGHEHAVAAIKRDGISTESWDPLISLLKHHIAHFSIIDKVLRYILADTPEFLRDFLLELYSADIDPVVRDRVGARLLALAFEDEKTRDRINAFLLENRFDSRFIFIDKLAKTRTARMVDKNYTEAERFAKEALTLANMTKPRVLSLSRSIFCYDEIIISKSKLGADTGAMIEAFGRIIETAREYETEIGIDPQISLCFKRDLSIIYGRLGGWLFAAEKRDITAAERELICTEVPPLLGAEPTSVMWLAIAAKERELELCERCLDEDRDESIARLLDIVEPLKSLARYHSFSLEVRDDDKVEEYTSRAIDAYRRAAAMEDDAALRDKRVADCIAFLQRLCLNYESLCDAERAIAFATLAVTFAATIESEFLGDHRTSYRKAKAEEYLAVKISEFSDVNDEALAYFECARRSYKNAERYDETQTEDYALMRVLVNVLVATEYTKADRHADAKKYNLAATEELKSIIEERGAENCAAVVDEYEAARVQLCLNRMFAPDNEIDSEENFNTLTRALFGLINSYRATKSKTAEGAIPLGYICAGVYCAKINTAQSAETIEALKSALAEIGLLDLIGVGFENAYEARFRAELAQMQGTDPLTVAELYEAAAEEYLKLETPSSATRRGTTRHFVTERHQNVASTHHSRGVPRNTPHLI
jgi:hypothetical protein